MHDGEGGRGARSRRDALDEATGLPATLYLNVLASAKPLLAEKVDDLQQVSIAAVAPGPGSTV